MIEQEPSDKYSGIKSRTCKTSGHIDYGAFTAHECVYAVKYDESGHWEECKTCGAKKPLRDPDLEWGAPTYKESHRFANFERTVEPTEDAFGEEAAQCEKAGCHATITLTVDPDKGYVLDTLTVLDGKDKEVKLTEKNGKYTFTMPAGKVTVEGKFKAEQSTGKNPFTDVPAGCYYEDAVIWAVDKGITAGTDATTFNPDGICTRAQIVTFLWRAAGSPESKSMSSFSDVSADSYYAKAVAWAVEKGITSGTGDRKFNPKDPCTRAQSVTFLYRAAGSPAVIGSAEFSDVASDTYYAAAVAWAAKNGITSGTGGGQFGSDNKCTRGHIVTFLFSAYGK